MAKYEVLHTAIGDKDGVTRFKGEILYESEILDAARFLEIGAIVRTGDAAPDAAGEVRTGDAAPDAAGKKKK